MYEILNLFIKNKNSMHENYLPKEKENKLLLLGENKDRTKQKKMRDKQ